MHLQIGHRPGQKLQTARPSRSGDVEHGHYRLKCAVRQALMLRDNRGVGCVAEYNECWRFLPTQLNVGRLERLGIEIQYLAATAGRSTGKPEAGAGESRFR